ncbi:DUF3857 and transglutaminase domain-containing protein [Uliginosibacterium gangwonense]|uniref:DUF3857 and transglutaminase domain-containing protein n=1 Tax=Uliginosibacterium gangwonense TaxID=392736 RepID=UPI00037CE3C3|nr:DUF3857 and transglutaminase domain-containing protein [Uliginosibacterium gangwonense]
MSRLQATLRIVALILFCALPSLPVPAQTQDAASLHEVTLPDTALRRDPHRPDWDDPLSPAANKPSAAVYLRLADTQIHVDATPTALIHRVIAANDSSVLSAIGQYNIIFQPDYQQVVVHTINILRGERSINKLADAKIRFVQKERDADSAIFTGWVTATVIVDDMRVGDSLEVAYSVIGENPVFNGHYFDSGSWDANVPVALRRFSVDGPGTLRYNHRIIGGNATNIEPEIINRNGRRIERFIERDLPAVEIDQFSPTDTSPLRWLQLSEFSSWREVVGWALGLFKTGPLPKEFAPIIADIRAGKTDDERILRAISFVQNDIRYVSMSLGEHSHRPFLPQEVLARRYGDCKDKTLLLVSLLREIGIKAHPVLVSTGNRRNLDTLLPSPLDFDHAIVKIVHNGKSWIVDPTLHNQLGSLEVFGDAHPSTWLLPVEPGNDKLFLTPPPKDALITVTRREHVTLTKMDGPAKMDVALEFSGLNAEQLRNVLHSAPPGQIRRYYAGLLDRRYNGAELLQEPVFDDDTQNNRMTVRMQYKIPQFLERSDNTWGLRYQASNLLEQFHVPNSAQRSTALLIPSYPFVGTYEFTATLPEEFRLSRKPYAKSLKNEGFSLDQELAMSKRNISAKITMRILADRVATNRVASFLDDLRVTNTMLGGTLYVDQSDLVSSAKSNKSLKENSQEQLESNVKAASSEIENTRLMGQEASAAYCERAQAHAYLSHTQQAWADAEAAIREKPGTATLLRCQALVQLITGNLPASEENLTRVTGLGQGNFSVFYQRGIARYYRRNYAAAVTDFAQAEKLATTPTDKAYAEYWRVLGLMRSKRPASSIQHFNAWPDAAVSMLEGKQSPEEIVKNLQDEKVSNALDTALTEAYLFIAQYYQLKGDTIKSRAYLQQAVDKGAFFNLMHHLAKLEQRP